MLSEPREYIFLKYEIHSIISSSLRSYELN